MGMAVMLIMYQDRLKNILFPRPLKATYKIWLQLAQWFQRRSRLKLFTADGRRSMPILIGHQEPLVQVKNHEIEDNIYSERSFLIYDVSA